MAKLHAASPSVVAAATHAADTDLTGVVRELNSDKSMRESSRCLGMWSIPWPCVWLVTRCIGRDLHREGRCLGVLGIIRRMDSPRSLPLIAALLCACSPALDWRQINPPELGVQALFPCRPSSLTRELALPQGRARMALHACSAAGSTFALAGVTLADVGEVTPTIDWLRDAASRNVGAAEPGPLQAFDVPGMTPNARAGRLVLKGRRPDGSVVIEHLLVFAQGAQVYQASVVGDAPAEAAVSSFFEGLKVVR
ncbi:MAG TPA: hypothetical protein VFU71_04535 [Burkholderiaceae bacterium]|nr:hypothetical protein [Burkholderiaceae bacterium]